MFDWTRFLQRHRIEYVTRGSSVVKGNLAIRCPWCGDSDPSHHLGISLSGEGWGCWRNRQHRGIRPHRLIRALINCSPAEAARLVGDAVATETVSDEAVSDWVSATFRGADPVETPPPLRFPPEIKPLRDVGMGRNFIDYLVGRRYTRRQARDLVVTYDLRYAYRGPFAYRVIVPIVMDIGLANWTGRAIAASDLRYRTLSCDPVSARAAGLPPAALPVDACLFNFAALLRDRYEVLVVVEGPFDALRLDYFGRAHGVRATCVFGTGNVSDAQVELLGRLRRRARRHVLMFDRGAEYEQLTRFARLVHLGFAVHDCPASDPAEIDQRDLAGVFALLASEAAVE